MAGAGGRDRGHAGNRRVRELIVNWQLGLGLGQFPCGVGPGRRIGRRPDDHLSRYIGGSARPVLDDKLLTQPLRQPLSDQARDDVLPAAWWEADDDAHRS